MPDEIEDLERAGWDALGVADGARFYGDVLAPDAVMALPFGFIDRDGAVASFDGAPPWEQHHLEDVRTIHLGDGAALVTYRATARRAGDESPYRALMTSVYRREGDRWRMVLHQQTPLA